MSFESCLEKGLLKKNAVAKDWAGKELESAEMFLAQARTILEAGAFESAEIIAYSSAFHSFRALLFAKGYSEKSHYCVFAGVSALYGESAATTGLANQASYLREARHDAAYGGKPVSKQEAESALETAKKAFANAKKTLKP